MKGESYVLGIPIPKTLVVWAFPSHTTLAIWVRVKVKVYTRNAHITRVLGMGIKRRDAHITGTPPPFLSPVSRTRLSRSLTRRIPDHPTYFPTYHPPTLDTSTFSPQIARQIIQDGSNLVTRVGTNRCLQSSIIFYHHNGFPLR